METSESTQSASRETCLGLPFVEERLINREERTILGQKARRSLFEKVLWGSEILAICLTFILMVVGYMNNGGVIFIVAITMMLFTICVAALMWRTENKCKAANEDLHSGRVKCYCGYAPGIESELALQEEIDEASAPKTEIGGVEVSLWQPITLEVFSDSRRLWSVNDTRVENIYCLSEEYTSIQPERAKKVAKWVEPARIIAENTIDISQSGQRELSNEERAEIRRRSRTGWRKFGGISLLLTLALGSYIIVPWVINGSFSLRWEYYFYLAFPIAVYATFIKDVRICWLLYKDANYGILIVIRYPDQIKEEKVLRKGPVDEWLPHSKRIWTINGEPAPWRLRQ